MNYTLTLPQAQVLAIISILEQVPAPLSQTYPIWANLKQQVAQQDDANAIEVR